MAKIGASIVILAGGKATRLPNKLERRLGDDAMLMRVLQNVRGDREVYVATQSSFSPAIKARLDCPILVDRWPDRGPLAALVSAAGALSNARVFAIAGDTPFATATLLDQLESAWQPADEAVVAQSDERPQPLIALYDRVALLREGTALVDAGERSMHALLARLHVRYLPTDARYLLNVNTPADLELATTLWMKGSP